MKWWGRRYDHSGVLHCLVRRTNRHWSDGRRGSLKKYKCRIATLTHILDDLTINGEVT